MTTREELIEVADERMENFQPTVRWDAGGRRQKTEAVTDAILAKLSEDDPERVKRAQRAACEHGEAACISDRQMQAALDAAGPVVVVERGEMTEKAEEHIHELEGDVAHAEQEATEMAEGCLSNKARAEKAEAELEKLRAACESWGESYDRLKAEAEAMRTAAAMYQDLDTANRERAERAEAALVAMQANWSNAKEQSKQAVERARTAQRKAEAAEETARSLYRQVLKRAERAEARAVVKTVNPETGGQSIHVVQVPGPSSVPTATTNG